MKRNILKMAGGAGLPFATYQPVVVNNAIGMSGDDEDLYGTSLSSTSKKSSTSSTSGEVTTKDLLTLLKDIDGLPSDMKQLYSRLNRFFDYLTLGIPNTSDLSTEYLMAIQDIKTAKYHKEVFDKAYENLKSNGGLNEVAVTDTGKIAVLTNNGVEFKSPNEALKLDGTFKPLTNSELLLLRAESAPGVDKYSAIASNGIGMEKIAELIKENLLKLGTNSSTQEGYISGKTKEGLQLIQQLMNSDLAAAGTDLLGLYEAKIVTKDLKNKIEDVLRYAYNMLPTNAKAVLAYNNGGSEKNAYNLIYKMLVGTTDQEKDITLNIIEDSQGNKTGKGSSSNSDKSETADLFTNIIRGEGGTAGSFSILDADGNRMSINGMNFPDLSRGEKRVEEGSLKTLLEDNGYNTVTKGGKYAITFGDLALTQADMSNIAFMNDRQATRVILPTTTDAKGNIVPDLKFMEEHKDLIALINSKGMQDPEVILQMQSLGLINERDGLPNMNMFLSYLCLNGLGTSRNIADETIKQEVTSDDNLIQQFENDVYRAKKDGDLGKAYSFDFEKQASLNPFNWLPGTYDKLYKGTIYIPLTENAVLTKIGSGTSMSQTKEDVMEAIYLQGEAMRTLQTTSSNLLNM